MKKATSISLLLLTIYGITTLAEQHRPKYVIGGRQVGFFSDFLTVLNHLLWVEQEGKTPVVYWGPAFLYYDPTAPNNNAWDYYFEPLSLLSYEPGDVIGNVNAQGRMSYSSPGNYQIPFNSYTCYEQEVRNVCHGIISKYIRVKEHIATKVSTFYDHHMRLKKTIGIHLRGTDKCTEVVPVNPQVIFEKANAVAHNLGADVQFFIATDEKRLLNLAKKYLKHPVIYRKSRKSEDLNFMSISNALPTMTENKLVLGEEVLIDVLLLAKCDALIHTLSNVSQAVAYFNPNLPCYLLQAR